MDLNLLWQLWLYHSVLVCEFICEGSLPPHPHDTLVIKIKWAQITRKRCLTHSVLNTFKIRVQFLKGCSVKQLCWNCQGYLLKKMVIWLDLKSTESIFRGHGLGICIVKIILSDSYAH